MHQTIKRCLVLAKDCLNEDRADLAKKLLDRSQEYDEMLKNDYSMQIIPIWIAYYIKINDDEKVDVERVKLIKLFCKQ